MTAVERGLILPYDQRDPDRVQFYDNTLREGDQSPGVAFSLDEKVEISKLLEAAGVDGIEVGMPDSGHVDFESVQAVAEEVRLPSISALTIAKVGSVEHAFAAVENAATPRIHAFIATSDRHMKAMGMTPDQIEKSAIEAVRRARELVDWVEFSPEDASRSDFAFMMRIINAVIQVGANIIDIPDTIGGTTPKKWAERTKKVRSQIDDSVLLATHCHDDKGLATANTLAAVEAGARQVEVAVNGVGERAGNASFEQVVANLKLDPDEYGEGLANHINTRIIGELSSAVRIAMDYPVIPNKPITGPNVFRHEAGIHVDKVQKDRTTYEIMDPEEYGWLGDQIAFGSHSGVNSFRKVAEDYGFAIPANFREIVQEIKDYCRETGRGVSEADVVDMFVLSNEIRYAKGYATNGHVVHQDDSKTTISFELYDTKSDTPTRAYAEVPSTSSGTIAATVKAFNDATGRSIDIVKFEEGIAEGESGSGSRAKTTIVVKNGGSETFKGKAISANTEQAHIAAFINAVNNMDRAEASV